MKNLTIIVKGRVQGVFFRVSTMNKAEELGLKGNVKNLPDKTVEIEVEGHDQAMSDFVEWCRQGPELANVVDLVISEGKTKNFTIFEIIRG